MTTLIEGEDRYFVRRMREADLPAVRAIEALSFSNPWSDNTFRGEIQNISISSPMVVVRKPGNPVVSGDRVVADNPLVPHGACAKVRVVADTPVVAHDPLVPDGACNPVVADDPPVPHGARAGVRVVADVEVVAYIVYWQIRDDVQINNIAVHPAHRGFGLGEAMMRYAIAKVRAAGAGFISLEVRQSNTAAVTLYKKLGFEILGTRKNYYTKPDEDAHVMGLVLDQ
jgi:ribosomal-protein-alanine acetyltransferase